MNGDMRAGIGAALSPGMFAMLVAAAVLLLAMGAVAIVLLVMRGQSQARVRRRLVGDMEADVLAAAQVDRPMLAGVARSGEALEAWVDAEGESSRLMLQAGWRTREQKLLWYVFQGVLPLVLAALAVGLAFGIESDRKLLLWVALGFATLALSVLMPRWILRSAAAGRRQRIKREVPLFIHLLVLLFEAGLSARQALTSIIREGAGVLPELGRELELALRQLNAGAETAETLRQMGDVLEVEDLSTVLAVLRQVDRYGGEVREPLLEVLELIEARFSLDLRERVNLLSGRMTVVMVLFFFPALLVFVAGPAFLSILKALGDVARG